MKAARASAPLLTAALLLSMWLTAPATATQTAKLNVSLIPEHLGAGTTISFAFQINGPHGQTPSPLTKVDLRYPTDFGLITSGLGLYTCTRAELEATGACPPDSLMGYGSALAEIPLPEDTIFETAKITTWMSTIQEGHIGLLFLAKAGRPVTAELIFPSLILSATPPFGGNLATTVPIVPTIPEGPNVSVTQLRSTIGPMHITYYQTFHGKTTAYHPQGIRLPHTCPHSGFPFLATFNFLDGTHASAKTSVACPARPSVN